MVFLAIIASVGGTWYLARTKHQLLGIQGQEVNQIQADVEDLVKEVGKIIALPEGEVPTIATVTDIDRVKEQTFFKNAQNGDKVLVYSQARKAFLYRPSEKRIIEVGVVNINQQEVDGQTEDQSQKSYKFALYNGTTTTGFTKSFETDLLVKVESAEIVTRENADRGYPTSVLIDLTGKRAEEAKELAEKLGIGQGLFPEGEKKPENADFLVILGSDRVPTPTPTQILTPTPTQTP